MHVAPTLQRPSNFDFTTSQVPHKQLSAGCGSEWLPQQLRTCGPSFFLCISDCFASGGRSMLHSEASLLQHEEVSERVRFNFHALFVSTFCSQYFCMHFLYALFPVRLFTFLTWELLSEHDRQDFVQSTTRLLDPSSSLWVNAVLTSASTRCWLVTAA